LTPSGASFLCKWTLWPRMSFEARRAQRTGTVATQRPDAELRAALAELRSANLEIALDDMRNQRDLWRAQAEWLAIVREACG
jgi:hypothetical protein